jgi:hypothetical protein
VGGIERQPVVGLCIALCAVLCCAVLCCAVLCCAVLCCAVLCCAVLCCAVLCCAVLCCAVRGVAGGSGSKSGNRGVNDRGWVRGRRHRNGDRGCTQTDARTHTYTQKRTHAAHRWAALRCRNIGGADTARNRRARTWWSSAVCTNGVRGGEAYACQHTVHTVHCILYTYTVHSISRVRKAQPARCAGQQGRDLPATHAQW